MLPYLDDSSRPRFRLTYIDHDMSEITQVYPFEVDAVFQLIPRYDLYISGPMAGYILFFGVPRLFDVGSTIFL